MANTINADNGVSSGSAGLKETADSSGVLALQTNGTTAVTVDTSQNVGIGYASMSQKLQVNGNIVLAASSGLLWDTSGSWQIASDDSTYIRFITGGSERMRIDSSGYVLVGQTASGLQNSKSVEISGSPDGRLTVNHINGQASGNLYINFGYNATQIGSIAQNGTTGVLYNITSDYRLKNNQQTLVGAKDFIMALKPKKWQWWDNSGEGVGFIAHEFMEVAKYSGNGTKDAVDANGNPIYQSIQPSSSEVMANLVSFIQEQQALITALTNRITALESK